MKNKGFSLVELIIVIAIMAILAAAIAPALIRYIDKSRRADDVTAAGTIESSVSAALANEDAYDVAVKDSTTLVAVVSKGNGSYRVDSSADDANAFKDEMESSLPKGADIKFKKKGAKAYSVYTTEKGQILVYISDNTAGNQKWEIRPSICKQYK